MKMLLTGDGNTAWGIKNTQREMDVGEKIWMYRGKLGSGMCLQNWK